MFNQAFFESYKKLKDRAWTGVLKSTNVESKLSSDARKRMENSFEQIKNLEFTATNIYGFLCGLADNRGDMQLAMACDVFDSITKYHSDNTVYFKGWKSNNAHRTCGMRIKTTRFILPRHSTESYQNGLNYESRQLLSDFDKVFAMLDGKNAPDVGLADVFDRNFHELRCGRRISSSYFDVRYYPGVGTIHFFARDKNLIDRLNRVVGRQRAWLPPEGVRVSEAFWLQYDKAEAFDKDVRKEVGKSRQGRYYYDPFYDLVTKTGDSKDEAAKYIDDALNTVLESKGISVDFRIEQAQKSFLLEAA